jgi:hypothetical protein
LWTTSFALEIKVFGPGGRTKFRTPLFGVAPHAPVESVIPDFLKQTGLDFFTSTRTERFNLLEDKQHIDFTSFTGGGVQLGAAGRFAVFMEVRYFTGLVKLARAGLAHLAFSNLKAHPMGLQAGFTYRLSADQR